MSNNKNRYSRLNRSINVGEARGDVSNLNADLGAVSPKSKLPHKISNDPVKQMLQRLKKEKLER